MNKVYGNPDASGMEYMIATWAFAFQIYGDFSGYTDIARGTSKCIGIELVYNFKEPYFASNPSDFWRRWHISLSSWLKDYLYIPLGGNKKGTWKTYRNLFLTMILGGLWHGAAWNFVIWGAYHGILLCIYKLFWDGREMSQSILKYLIKSFLMFQVICLGWIFFRAQSFEHIILIFRNIVNLKWLTSEESQMFYALIFYSIIPTLIMLYRAIREKQFPSLMKTEIKKYLEFSNIPIWVKSGFAGVLAYLLCLYGAKAQAFIYFQF